MDCGLSRIHFAHHSEDVTNNSGDRPDHVANDHGVEGLEAVESPRSSGAVCEPECGNVRAALGKLGAESPVSTVERLGH